LSSHNQGSRNLLVAAAQVTVEAHFPVLRRGHHGSRRARGHRPDRLGQHFRGVIICAAQGHARQGPARRQPLEQQGSFDILIDAYDPSSFERVHDFARSPLVSATLDDLQDDRVVSATAERKDRAVGLGDMLDRDSPRLEPIIDPAPEVRP
jgi:hypothetical protein